MKGSTEAEPIPTYRRKVINDPSDLPDRYSSTPNGTLYSTTPGGTHIIYERNFLMNLKNSPLARSPPGMAYIPGVTNITPTAANNHYKALQNQVKNVKAMGKTAVNKKKMTNNNNHHQEQPQFDMEI